MFIAFETSLLSVNMNLDENKSLQDDDREKHLKSIESIKTVQRYISYCPCDYHRKNT
jgi:hypothetical protein